MITITPYSSAHLPSVMQLVVGFCAEKKLDQDQVNALKTRLQTSVLMVAESDGHPVGLVAFQYDKPERTFYARIAYVIPQYRNRALYGLMWRRIKKLARENNVAKLTLFTSLDDAHLYRTKHDCKIEGYILTRRIKHG